MKKRFGFLAFEGVEELNLIGPWEMVGIWRDFADGPESIIVGPRIGPIVCSRGLKLHVAYDYYTCPSIDYLLIPGGNSARTQRYDASTLHFIRELYLECQYLLCVCTGIFILNETGLLKGKKVATYHLIKEELKKRTRDIQIIDSRYYQDGKIWTSTGIFAGIDMLLAFINLVSGEEIAGKVQYLCEYYPEQKTYPFLHPAPTYLS